MPRSAIGGSRGRLMFNFIRSCFKSGYTILQAHQQCYAFQCYTSLPTCRSIVSLFNFSYSSRSEVVSHYVFTHIPQWQCCTSLMCWPFMYFLLWNDCSYIYPLVLMYLSRRLPFPVEMSWCLCQNSTMHMWVYFNIFYCFMDLFVYPYANTILPLFQ